MNEIIEGILNRFEHGQVSRRDVVLALSSLFVSVGNAGAQPTPAPIAVRSLNHASISVADVDRSVQFYQSMFGMRVISREGVSGNPTAGGGSNTVVVNLALDRAPSSSASTRRTQPATSATSASACRISTPTKP